MNKFELGQKVRHVAAPEFDMVVKGFAVNWENDGAKIANQIPNPEYPICSYYNRHTNQWEEQMFHVSELQSQQ